jgi:N-methylhydantoinase B
VIEKVAFSTVASEGHDYSCAFTNIRGDTVSRGRGGLPLIGGTIGYRVRAVLAAIPAESLQEGDVILFNDPYTGGTHAQDVSAVLPVFSDGEMIGLVQTCSHWPDVGGPIPGSFNSEALSSHGEALLIPPIHIVRRGIWQQEVENFILRNVRIAQVIAGDLRGLTEAARMGEAQLLKLVKKFGKETILKAMDGFMSYSERLLRLEFAKLSGQSVSWTDYIDRDPGADTDEPVRIRISVSIAGDRAKIDLGGSGAEGKGPINCSLAATSSAVVAVLKAIYPHIPLNDGLLRAFDLVLPDNCVVNAKYPAPVSGHASNSAEKLVSCMHGCFIQLTPERAMCAPTNLVNLSIFGHDSRFKHNPEYVFYMWLCGGWGGRKSSGDGQTHMMPLAAGTRLLLTETLERIYPIQVEGYGLMSDSEGAGTSRGGFGVRFSFRMTHGDFTVNTQGDRERIVNWGYVGGLPATGNKVLYAPGTGHAESVGIMRAGFKGKQGELVDFWQGGGGGYGSPLDRDPNRVLKDVRDGLVSLERARNVYGVSIKLVDDDLAEFALNDAETALLRAPKLEELEPT